MRLAVCRALIAVLCVVLAAFFAFVGWNKAFASLADLSRYHAWTIYLAEPLGRAIGWSEMALALGLLAALHPRGGRIATISALALVANQVVAAAVHLAQGERGALPQNAILIGLLLAGMVMVRVQSNPREDTAR